MSDKSARVSEMSVRFARSATKHRISKESIRHVIAHCGLCFDEPPPSPVTPRFLIGASFAWATTPMAVHSRWSRWKATRAI